MDRPGHFGGAMLLFFGIMYFLPKGDTIQTLGLSVTAAGIAAAMSMKPDMDKKFFRGIFHRCWITHSLTTVAVVTVGAFALFSYALREGRWRTTRPWRPSAPYSPTSSWTPSRRRACPC